MGSERRRSSNTWPPVGGVFCTMQEETLPDWERTRRCKQIRDAPEGNYWDTLWHMERVTIDRILTVTAATR